MYVTDVKFNFRICFFQHFLVGVFADTLPTPFMCWVSQAGAVFPVNFIEKQKPRYQFYHRQSLGSEQELSL